MMTDEELLKRDSERDIWQETLDAVRDIKAGNTGTVNHIAISQVTEARQKVGMSQENFAELLGVSVRTLKNWEQGRSKPNRTVLSLLKIAQQRPDVLREVFN